MDVRVYDLPTVTQGMVSIRARYTALAATPRGLLSPEEQDWLDFVEPLMNEEEDE